MEKIADQERGPQSCDPTAIPRAIRNLRKTLGLTQDQLARKLFVWRNSVSRYELGSIKPSPQVLFIIMLLAREIGQGQPFADALAEAGTELESAPHRAPAMIPVSGEENKIAMSENLIYTDRGDS
jgi:transcriptional regulator with XRE-family HTH domain